MLGIKEIKGAQRLIALNFWSVDCPTWDSSHTEDGEVVFTGPRHIRVQPWVDYGD
jgi:hypothetical protein